MGIAALVLGILGTLFSIIPLLFWLGVVLSVIALVLGIFGRKAAAAQGQPTGSATAGMVLGLVGTVLGVLMWVWCHSLVKTGEKMGDEFKKGLDKAMEEAKTNKTGRPLEVGAAIKTTPKALVADYVSNEVAADGKYKGKTVEVTGTVDAVAKDLFDNAFVSLESGDDTHKVQVYFDGDNEKKIGTLKRGEKVTILGRVDGYMFHVKLKDSQLK